MFFLQNLCSGCSLHNSRYILSIKTVDCILQNGFLRCSRYKLQPVLYNLFLWRPVRGAIFSSVELISLNSLEELYQPYYSAGTFFIPVDTHSFINTIEQNSFIIESPMSDVASEVQDCTLVLITAPVPIRKERLQ